MEILNTIMDILMYAILILLDCVIVLNINTTIQSIKRRKGIYEKYKKEMEEK